MSSPAFMLDIHLIHTQTLSLMRTVDTLGDLQGKSAAVFPVGAQLNAKQLLRKMDMCVILKPS